MQTLPKCVASGLLALLVASLGVRTSVATDAAALNTNCAKCHPRVSTLARSLKGDTRDERADALAVFLASHHCEDPQVREEIVGYVVDLSSP